MAHRLVHLAAVAEAHLDLGRVHVHVDARGVDLEVEHVDRLALAVQHVLVGAAHRVRQHLVAHETAVDVEELVVGARARRIGDAGAADHAHRAAHMLDDDALRHEILAERIAQALLALLAGAPLLDQLAVVPDREAHVGPRQRMAAHRLDAVGELGGIGLEELAPRRGREEQLAHLDRGAARTRHRAQFARAAVERPGAVGTHRARLQAQLGDRVDGGQRLAAKAHGADRLEVVEARDLAGGMAPQRHHELLARDAQAVVLDRDQPHAAGRQSHRDLRRARVERVVEQLAHHRGRAFDHLARGDLADQLVGEFADRAAFGGGEGGGGKGAHRTILEAGPDRPLGRGIGCICSAYTASQPISLALARRSP